MLGSLLVLIAFFNNLVHSRDVWTSGMPAGFALSLVTVLLMLATRSHRRPEVDNDGQARGRPGAEQGECAEKRPMTRLHFPSGSAGHGAALGARPRGRLEQSERLHDPIRPQQLRIARQGVTGVGGGRFGERFERLGFGVRQRRHS